MQVEEEPDSDFVVGNWDRACRWVGIFHMAWTSLPTSNTSSYLACICRIPAAAYHHLSGAPSLRFSGLAGCSQHNNLPDCPVRFCLAQSARVRNDGIDHWPGTQSGSNRGQWRLYAN